MKREDWTPSRHQYLCSEHFTEDCFDIRWGIRYLQNTAIPTIFPPAEDVFPCLILKNMCTHIYSSHRLCHHYRHMINYCVLAFYNDINKTFLFLLSQDGEKKSTTIKRSTKVKPTEICPQDEPTGFDSPLSKRPLILSRTCKKLQSGITNNTVGRGTEIMFELPLISDTGDSCGISCHANLSETQTAACEILADGSMQTSSCLALSPCNSEEQTDSVTMLCCQSLDPFSDMEARVDGPSIQAVQGQTFSFIPVEMLQDESVRYFLEERGAGEGEHISVHEHSYCRPDTDKDQLWSKILNLHAKILELDRREESTVAKINALETEIALLKKDGAVFTEKQKVLEDYISSMLV